MTKERIDKLISLTKEKNELINNMLHITRKQMGEIKAEDMEDLNNIMDRKDKLIKSIDELDRSFLSIFSQIKTENSIEDIDQLDVEMYPNLKELKKQVEDVNSTLLALSLIDKENRQSMKEKFENARMNLRKVKNGKKAYKGYNSKITESMLIDKKK